MKAILPLLFICVVLSNESKAQCQTVNGDFESWTDYTDTFEYELGLQLKYPVIFPTEWYSIVRLLDLALSNFFGEYLDRDTLDIPVFDGVLQYMPGANGTGSAARLSGDSLLLAADLIQLKPCGGRPEKLNGYFKYEGTGFDTLVIGAILHNDGLLDTSASIGYASFTIVGSPDDISRDAADFSAFSADFIYNSDEIPDSVTILILTIKDEQNPSDTSYFVVDEIEFEGGAVPTRDYYQEAPFALLPNPASDQIRLNLEVSGDVMVQIFDALGQVVTNTILSVHNTLSVQHLPAGTYLGRIQAGKEIFWQKIVVSH